ncbi:MAG: hypothetical protein RLZZ01_1981 [Actinomycetota bacterium]|jgi:predicted RNA-binding protein YlxR (DUF448 family)
MVRFVVADGTLCLDLVGPGRGAWVCGRECLAEAGRRNGFDRAFRRRIDPGQVESIVIDWDELAGTTGSEVTRPMVGCAVMTVQDDGVR